jgi:hypothetical protein
VRTYYQRFRNLSAFRKGCFTVRVLQVNVQVGDAYFRCLGIDGGFDSHVGGIVLGISEGDNVLSGEMMEVMRRVYIPGIQPTVDLAEMGHHRLDWTTW